MARDICDGVVIPEVIGFDCVFSTRNEGNDKRKRIDKTDTCVVEFEGDTVTVLDSGGVGNTISWEVRVGDSSGNVSVIECEVAVARN